MENSNSGSVPHWIACLLWPPSPLALDRWQMGVRLRSCCAFPMRRSGKLVSCHVWEVTVELLVPPLCCLQWEAREGKIPKKGPRSMPVASEPSLDKSINWKSHVASMVSLLCRSSSTSSSRKVPSSLLRLFPPSSSGHFRSSDERKERTIDLCRCRSRSVPGAGKRKSTKECRSIRIRTVVFWLVARMCF